MMKKNHLISPEEAGVGDLIIVKSRTHASWFALGEIAEDKPEAWALHDPIIADSFRTPYKALNYAVSEFPDKRVTFGAI